MLYINDTPTTEIYTLSLHDALPIFQQPRSHASPPRDGSAPQSGKGGPGGGPPRNLKARPWMGSAMSNFPSRFRSQAARSEEHTSELQSRLHLVCRLLLEKKKRTQ